jgi:hypothetical protein
MARFTKAFEIDRVVYLKGDTIVLEESTEYAPAFWIINGDSTTTDLLSNEYGVVFEIVVELSKAA